MDHEIWEVINVLPKSQGYSNNKGEPAQKTRGRYVFWFSDSTCCVRKNRTHGPNAEQKNIRFCNKIEAEFAQGEFDRVYLCLHGGAKFVDIIRNIEWACKTYFK